MTDKPPSSSGEGAQQVFRQFAWNLAGTLAQSSRRKSKPAARSQPARRTNAKRSAAK